MEPDKPYNLRAREPKVLYKETKAIKQNKQKGDLKYYSVDDQREKDSTRYSSTESLLPGTSQQDIPATRDTNPQVEPTSTALTETTSQVDIDSTETVSGNFKSGSKFYPSSQSYFTESPYGSVTGSGLTPFIRRLGFAAPKENPVYNSTDNLSDPPPLHFDDVLQDNNTEDEENDSVSTDNKNINSFSDYISSKRNEKPGHLKTVLSEDSKQQQHYLFTGEGHKVGKQYLKQEVTYKHLQAADNNSISDSNSDYSLEEEPPVFNNQQQQNNMANNAFGNTLALSFRPQAYSGKQNGDKWLQKFTRYCQLTDINNDNKCRLFSLCLTELAETWFNALADDIKQDYDQLTAAFREKFITAEPTKVQRQIADLARCQLPNETVDQYITEAREKMIQYGYGEDLQMTLLINGLKPNIRSVVLQHLPFDNLNAFITKAKHVEAAVATMPAYTTSPYLPPSSMKYQGQDCVVFTSDTPEKVWQQANMLSSDREDMKLELKQTLDDFMSKIEHRLENLCISKDNEQNTRAEPRNKLKKGSPVRTRAQTPPTQRCYICDSRFHIQRNCPEKINNKQVRFSTPTYNTNWRGNNYYRNQSYRGRGRGSFTNTYRQRSPSPYQKN